MDLRCACGKSLNGDAQFCSACGTARHGLLPTAATHVAQPVAQPSATVISINSANSRHPPVLTWSGLNPSTRSGADPSFFRQWCVHASLRVPTFWSVPNILYRFNYIFL